MKIIAVTACPAGIAHSEMAAEALEMAAEEMGYDIHVEVASPLGTENELSKEDIAEAGVCILATSIHVPTDRFSDLPVLKTGPQQVIADAAGVIREAVEKADG